MYRNKPREGMRGGMKKIPVEKVFGAPGIKYKQRKEDYGCNRTFNVLLDTEQF